MNCLAIIPARGGSKGIPHKNVRPLAGKPLIAYNIEQAQRSKWINRLVVSTDDAEIAAVARQYGAEVVWRPSEISGDTASSELALLHTMEYLEQAEGYLPEIVVFLQCTSPLTLAEDMDGTVQALLDQQADSALAVMPFHYFLWKPDATGDVVGINHDKLVRPLRQQREPQYLETGAVYVMRAQGFRQARHRFFGKTALYEMPAERRLEIDDPVDLKVAEVLLRAQESQRGLACLPDPVAAVVFDFDGVFTDNKVITFQDGREAAISNRSDGWGIARLRKTGLPLLVLSTETSPVVQARCDKLRIPCQQGLENKAEALQRWLDERVLPASQVVYVGNDGNDNGCMELVGCPVAVADAYPEALERAALVLKHSGGNGAVREICDLVLKSLTGA
jgi:YrbI family 3-deoxy-D-manno-octulosonate 8-phosphate phosphatase